MEEDKGNVEAAVNVMLLIATKLLAQVKKRKQAEIENKQDDAWKRTVDGWKMTLFRPWILSVILTAVF